MKGPTKIDEIYPKHNRTYDEAKTSCKARKRKERQESVNSLCQEHKVIRSNSEERPRRQRDIIRTIRRVSSNEDVHRPDRKTTGGGSVEKIEDECDYYEERRSRERFAKPSKLRPHKPKKSPKMRQIKFKPELRVQSDETDHVQIDLSTLHEQIDCAEPIPSASVQSMDDDMETLPSISVASNRLLSSPRNSVIATHRIYLDPDVQQQQPLTNTTNPFDFRLHKINKQINSLKKKIKKYENEFEIEYGYRLSHAGDAISRKLYVDLNRMKKEQKQLIKISANEVDDGFKLGKNNNLQYTVKEIEKKLIHERTIANRSINLEDMSNDELMEEKMTVQKALLILESLHGRPKDKDDKNLVRPMYDRYRSLKRLISKTNGMGNELATIHENETMNFITPTTQQSPEREDSEISSLTTTLTTTTTDEADTDDSVDEKLHALTRTELLEQQRLMMEEKKELRRTIKSYENDAMMQMRKSGKKKYNNDPSIDAVYAVYKKVKAKLKLIDALIAKL